MQEGLLVVLFVLALAWLIVKIRQRKVESTATPPRKGKTQSPYHAVSITYTENACLAAKQMTGRRFLASAAPRLPLAECNALECRCNFTHYDDRRDGHDRRSPFSGSGHGSSTGKFEQERRSPGDRRRHND